MDSVMFNIDFYNIFLYRKIWYETLFQQISSVLVVTCSVIYKARQYFSQHLLFNLSWLWIFLSLIKWYLLKWPRWSHETSIFKPEEPRDIMNSHRWRYIFKKTKQFFQENKSENVVYMLFAVWCRPQSVKCHTTKHSQFSKQRWTMTLVNLGPVSI